MVNYNPFALVKVDEETGEIIRGENGLCITCQPGEVGEMVGLVRTGDRGGPEKFKAYVDKDDPNKGKIITDVWKKGDMCFRYHLRLTLTTLLSVILRSGDILEMDHHGWLYFKDRKGDTFRWRGENVSTAEVEAVISNLLGHTSAVVYGVEVTKDSSDVLPIRELSQVPGAEGRAGMAAIVKEGGKIDLKKLATGLRKSLPHYARPMFVRLIKELQMTGTYKLQKTTLQDEGFDVTKVNDDIFFMGPKDEEYRILDLENYQNLLSNLHSSKL